MPPLTPGQGAFTEFLSQSGPVAKAVLVILLVLSVISWAIMYRKAGCSGACGSSPGGF